MRKNLILVAVAAAAALTSTYAAERDALACGGCFHPPPSPTETPTIVTDHRMILSISKGQSTLYDQIKYQGNPSSFAWVLPISGTVTVGLSADIVFQTLDGITTTSIVAPPQNCPAAPQCNNRNQGASFSDSAGAGGYADAGAASPPGVVVTKKEVVGPYETVQLKATDANALEQWLTTNGFAVPPEVQPVVDKYVSEKFDFLALKLIPGKQVQDMRPVRVTTTGASAVLPLRMVAAGTGATVGISLWVLGEGRYEPQNFPSFFIPTTDIAWDWNQSKSNYTELRAAKTTAAAGRGWETESSTILYPQQVESAVTSAGYYGGGTYPYPGPPVPTTDGGADAGPPLDPQEQAAQINYDPVLDGQGNVLKTAVQVRSEDLAALFAGIPTASSRVTRMRADLAHAALDADLVMTASTDQTVLSNVRQLTKELNEPLCPVYSTDGCSQIGTAPRSEAAARTNGDTAESFSCTTGGVNGSSPIWMGAGLGYLAMAIARARRRRGL
jgi:MYXO-CTERM domain-containing protein